jgi:hypothetical protein
MQDIERAEPRLMTTQGPGEFPQNSRPETSRIDWFHKCIDLSIGRPTSIPFSADGLWTREPMILPRRAHLYPAVVLEILHTT